MKPRHHRLLSLAILSLAAVPAAAQAASVTSFGTPCAYSAPPLAALNLPQLGQTFQLQSRTYGPGGGYEGPPVTVLFVGASRSSWRGLPLPWGQSTLAAQLGVGSCGELSISPDDAIRLPMSLQGGPAVVDLPVPNAPALIGLSVYFQAADYRITTRGVFVFTLGSAIEARVGR